jgi:hypothetical protein
VYRGKSCGKKNVVVQREEKMEENNKIYFSYFQWLKRSEGRFKLYSYLK